jgi:phospholipid transport system substrate-binding protein
MFKKIAIVLVWGLFVGTPQHSPIFGVSLALCEEQASAKAQVTSTIDEVVRIVESLPGDNNRSERRTKLRQVIDARFDFDEMSKRSLGTNWAARTPAEQKEFISLFSDLLARTYLNRIEEVESGMVKIVSENGDDKKATVKTKILLKDESFPIDYKLLNEGGNWRVYDVVIENIGLVANYRNEFAGIIRKEEFSGLIKRLKEKVASS